MEQPLYRYLAEVVRVIDGDTVELIIDEGFKHSWKASCRMAGINAAELNSSDEQERYSAIKAKNYLTSRLTGTQVYIISQKLDKYGRPIVTIYLNGENINTEMVKNGYAKVYM